MSSAQYQTYGDEGQLDVVTDLGDVVQLVVWEWGVTRYIYLSPDGVHRLRQQLREWEEET